MFSHPSNILVHEIRKSALQSMARARTQLPNCPRVIQKLATSGFYHLTPDELEDVKKEFPQNEFQIDVYPVFDSITRKYNETKGSLQNFIDAQDLSQDPIKGRLYTLAKNQVLPEIEKAGKASSFKQLAVLTEFAMRTQIGIDNPSDEVNNRAYDKLYRKVAGQRSFSNTLKSILGIFFGALLLTAALACYVATFTVCPVFILPTFALGVLGALTLIGSVTSLSDEVKDTKKNAYADAMNASRMFNRHLQRKPVETAAMQKEEASVLCKIRRMVVGGHA
jgi:hypothetical protein